MGLSLEDSLRTAANLAAMGMDAVEVSGGLPFLFRNSPVRLRIDAPEKEAYFRRAGSAFKEKVRAPIILVGGAEVAENNVRHSGWAAGPTIWPWPDLSSANRIWWNAGEAET